MNTKTTKKERRAAQLERHYKAISDLLNICGVSYPNADNMYRVAKRTSSKLLQIERISHKAATDYCNGDINTDTFDRISGVQTINVQLLFKNNLKGLFINSDARGYALKIKDDLMRGEGIYSNIGLQTDWGGYGLLAPEITGN